MSADSTARAAFINNLLLFIQQNGYDGVDFDWEFPANAIEKNQYTLLIKELKTAASQTFPNLLVTIAASPGDWFGRYFDFENMTQYLDWINVMGYNFHGSWTQHSGHNAPLYTNPADPDKPVPGSDDDGVKYLSVTRKVPKNKLVLGLPFYGKQFNASGLFAVQSGAVYDLIYNPDIATKLNDINWKYNWDDVSKVPYLVAAANSKFITFDDTASVKYKCDYVKANGLAGVMIWALGYDYSGSESPLLRAIGKSLILSAVAKGDEYKIPEDFKLYDNYPNPFNPSTHIRFELPKGGHVKIIVFDALGREVKVLIDQFMNAGNHETLFDASHLNSGVYFYCMQSQNFIQGKKMILIK